MEHPCPKAVTEMQFLVEHLSKPGDIVLDPYCGIGATLIAAKQLWRHFIGCDLWRLYCEIALRRLQVTQPVTSLPVNWHTRGWLNGPTEMI